MAWYNSSWTKRKPITNTGGASGSQSSYQMKYTVSYESSMKSDFSDLRFTKLDGTTLLDSWMESHTASTSAIVWVETDTPANTVEADIYMYYGNSGAASDWDGRNTFIEYDGFEDGDTTDAGDLFVTSVNRASTEQARSGSYSIKLPTSTAEFSQSMSSLSLDAHRCDFYVYITSTSGRVTTFQIFDSDGSADTNSGCVCKCESGVVYNYSGSWQNTGITYSSTGWKSVSILQGSTTFDINFDGQTASSKSNRNTISNIDKFKFGSTGLQYYDDVRVRKYAANPATYAFGSEESEPSGNPYWYYNMLRRRN